MTRSYSGGLWCPTPDCHISHILTPICLFVSCNKVSLVCSVLCYLLPLIRPDVTEHKPSQADFSILLLAESTHVVLKPLKTMA